MREYFTINLGGLAGDLIMGGSFLKVAAFLGPIDEEKRELIARRMGCESDLLGDFDDYLGMRTIDFYFLKNRVRRFTYAGAKIAQPFFEERAPFFDNELMEFVYSIPDRFRLHSHIYKITLLRTFPDYFRSIPWAKTSEAIGWSQPRRRFSRLSRRAIRILGRYTGLNVGRRTGFSDYASWIRDDPARGIFRDYLCNRNALYTGYLPGDHVREQLDRHLDGQDLTVSVCRYLTFEIWLQQLFKKNHRPDSSNIEFSLHAESRGTLRR